MRLSDLYTTSPFGKSKGDQFKVDLPNEPFFPIDEKPKDVSDEFYGLQDFHNRIKYGMPNRVGKGIKKSKTGGIDSQIAVPPAGGVSV